MKKYFKIGMVVGPLLTLARLRIPYGRKDWDDPIAANLAQDSTFNAVMLWVGIIIGTLINVVVWPASIILEVITRTVARITANENES